MEASKLRNYLIRYALAVLETAVEQTFAQDISRRIHPTNAAWFQSYWIGLEQDLLAPGYNEPGGGWGWQNGQALVAQDWLAGMPDNVPANSDRAVLHWQTFSDGWKDVPENEAGVLALIESPVPLHDSPLHIEWANGDTTRQRQVLATTDTTIWVRVSVGDYVRCDTARIFISSPLFPALPPVQPTQPRPEPVSLMLYPQPAQAYCFLHVPGEFDPPLAWFLSNSQGQVVKHARNLRQADDHPIELSLSRLPAGYFWLKVIDSRGKTAQAPLIKIP